MKCPNCQIEINADECEQCGWSKNESRENETTLPPETLLKKRYKIESYEGQQDEIQLYLALDTQTDSTVLIKRGHREGVEEVETDIETAPTSTDECSKPETEKQEKEARKEEIEADTPETKSDIITSDNNNDALDSELQPVEESVTEEYGEDEEKKQANEPESEAQIDTAENQTDQGDVTITARTGETITDEEETVPDEHITKLSNPRLEEERRLLALVDYPTIPKVLDCFDEDGNSYLVLPYWEGKTLEESWKTATKTERLDYLIQLCQGLAKIHLAGIIYCAIEPSKLIVNQNNRLTLSDFSKAFQPLLNPERKINATCYTAPEFIEDEVIDCRADIYSVGATWLECLLGRRLTFDDLEGFTLKTPYELVPDLKDAFLLRMLAKLTSFDPQLRFATDEELDAGIQPASQLQQELLKLKMKPNFTNIIYGAQSDTGLVRSNNEDSFFAQMFTLNQQGETVHLGLFVVADGMGGEAAGAKASELTVKSITNRLIQKLLQQSDVREEMFLEFIKNEIIQAITNANEKVFQLSKRNPLYRGMGSTVVLAVVRNNLVCLANVGDSPAFLISELTGIEQKTEEHTHVNELVKEGKITKEDALSHPDRGILTRAIGPKSTVEAALVDFCVEADDFLLLCSDGLTQHVEHETIKEVITQLSPQEACAKLVNLSNQNGGTDNTTCVVVSWR